MNLVELFQTLAIPEDANDKILNAVPIPDNPNHRIAVGIDGYPVLLLSVLSPDKDIRLKNHRLKYLQIEQAKECKISEGRKVYFRKFTIITFMSNDDDLCDYFLRLSETLIKSLNIKTTHQEVVKIINRFIEVFRALSEPPSNTIQGLWSELFLIENSKDPKTLLFYWHNSPEEKFDFNAGEEKIEMKSSSTFERIHVFSSSQLNPPEGAQVLIGSVFIRQNNSGQNIQQLSERIASKIRLDIDLVDKLNIMICRTLGNSLEESIKIKYDYKIAKESLRFYKHQEISKVEEIYIPAEVSEVKFKSDLSSIKSVDIAKLKPKGNLFSSI